MKRVTIFCMVAFTAAMLLVCGLAGAAETKPDSSPQQDDIKIILPVFPPGPDPEPAPAPIPEPKPKPDPPKRDVTDLKADHWYVIESEHPFFVLDSRIGFVNIGYEQGPLKLRGRFADGTGSIETREYKSKCLATIEAVKPGQVEILVIPSGAKDASVILRRTLNVMGDAPKPPPGPEPDPDDPPVPPGPVTSFRVIFVKESGDSLPIGQTAVPGAKVIRDYLAAKTTPEGGLVGWREYDPDQITTNEQPIMKALWETVKPKLLPAPCMIIEVNGRAIVMPFPQDVDDAMKILKQYGGA